MLRFAPSPNGFLHKGHALSALLNGQAADALGLPLTVRMEDIDKARCRPEHEAAIADDLAWLGLVWEGPVLRQSSRFDAYAKALRRLREADLLVPSVMTRREIADAARRCGLPRDPDGAPIVTDEAGLIGREEYARRVGEGEPRAWRLSMSEAVRRTGPLDMEVVDAQGRLVERTPVTPEAWGNVVLARKETPTSYHLAVVVDDAHQGITHVVRGEDLRAATAVHRVLQTLLGLPAPAYHHHRLILGADGRKLSKSNGAESLKALREAGVSAQELRASLLA